MKIYYSDKLEVGIDEVARGCLAGPVFSAAVIWPKDLNCEIQNQIKNQLFKLMTLTFSLLNQHDPKIITNAC